MMSLLASSLFLSSALSLLSRRSRARLLSLLSLLLSSFLLSLPLLRLSPLLFFWDVLPLLSEFPFFSLLVSTPVSLSLDLDLSHLEESLLLLLSEGGELLPLSLLSLLPLAEELGLDPPAARLRAPPQPVRREVGVQGIGSLAGQRRNRPVVPGRHHPDPPEASDVAVLESLGSAEMPEGPHVRVARRGADPEPTGHPQVHDDLPVVVEIDQQVLARPPHPFHRGAGGLPGGARSAGSLYERALELLQKRGGAPYVEGCLLYAEYCAEEEPAEAAYHLELAARIALGLESSSLGTRVWEAFQRIAPDADLPAAQLNPRYTFDTFVRGPSNQMAHAACESVAERPGEEFSPLFLFGHTGLGKTHLLHAIGAAAKARRPGLRVVYLSAEQWVNEYIHELRQQRISQFRRRYRKGWMSSMRSTSTSRYRRRSRLVVFCRIESTYSFMNVSVET